MSDEPTPFDDDREEALSQEAEELMRQGRYRDAASRYQDLRRIAPGDLWATLGHASALECAGDLPAAERLIEDASGSHRANLHLLRFRRMFFERREDFRRATALREAIRDQGSPFDGSPPDQLADLFFNQGRYTEALNELGRVLREEDCSDDVMRASVLARIGACLRQDGELHAARDHLIEALDLEGANHWTLAELAEAERALGDLDAARERYLEALEANPDDHWCRGHLAQLEHEAGRSERAVALYEEVLEAQPRATWAMVELAQVVTEREPERAEQLCREALDEDPSYPWAWSQLGVLSRVAGEFRQAREHFQQALAASPTSTWILHELADVCRSLGRQEEARTHLDHARSIDPFDGTSYGYTADILRAEGQIDEAVPYLVKAVELDPGYAWAWRELAEVQAQRGEHEAADRAYEEACKLEPGDPINDGLRAYLLRCRGLRDQAQPFLEQALAGQSDYLWAWRELVEYHLLRGDGEQAEREARRGLEAVPDSPPLWALLAEALRQQGRRDDALDYARKALGSERGAPQLWALCAELELDQDGEAAEAKAARALELEDQVDFRLLLAQIQLARGREAAADATLTPVLAADVPPAAALDLGCELAERLGEDQRLDELLERALRAWPGHPRLLLRHARRQTILGRPQPSAPLQALFHAAEPVPWREVAQLFAQDGDRMSARRAAALVLHEAGDDGSERARAWLLTAEVELAAGERDAARQAAERALEHDPQLPAALVMAAMLNEGPEHAARAAGLLDELDRQCRELEDLTAPERALLLRQLALLYDRQDRPEAAEAAWARARTVADGPELRLEQARHLLRRRRADEADTLIDETRAQGWTLDPEFDQQLLIEQVQARYHRRGAGEALALLRAHPSPPGPEAQRLLAQLLLADGAHADAEAELTTMIAADDRSDLRLLLARAQIGQLRPAAAREVLAPLRQREPDNEAAATLEAEALALDGQLEPALATVRDPQLGRRASPERALLGACLLLEARGEPAALAWLGRHLRAADHGLGAVRVLAAAWPDSFSAPDPEHPAALDDLRSLPPLPRMAERLATALIAADRGDLAATLLLLVAATAEGRDQAATARRLRGLAVAPLRRLGRRGLALQAAWSARSPLRLLRCLLP